MANYPQQPNTNNKKMSDPHPGPYKSRLFSFASRQYHLVADKLALALRQFKVAATWSIQLIFSPIYFLLNPHQLTGKKSETQAEIPPSTSESASKSSSKLTKDLQIDWQNFKKAQPSASPSHAQHTPLRSTEAHSLMISSDLAQPEIYHPSFPLADPKIDHKSLADQSINALIIVASESLEIRSIISNINPLAWPPNQTLSDKIAYLKQGFKYLASFLPGHTKPLILDSSIQGFASLISNRRLVLVTHANQTLDILNNWQQFILQQRINQELIKWESQQKTGVKGSEITTELPKLSDALPQVNWDELSERLTLLADWMQKESEAIIQVVNQLSTPPKTADKGEGEGNSLAISKLPELVQGAIVHLFKPSETSALTNINHPETKPDEILVVNQEPETPWLTMQELFESHIETVPVTAVKPVVDLSDQQLIMIDQLEIKTADQGDRFVTAKNQQNQSFLVTVGHNSNEIEVTPNTAFNEMISNYLPNPQVSSELSNLTVTTENALNNTNPSSATVTVGQNDQATQSEYLETKVNSAKYLPNLWERLLVLLDSIMLLLETVASAFWQWLKQRWQTLQNG